MITFSFFLFILFNFEGEREIKRMYVADIEIALEKEKKTLQEAYVKSSSLLKGPPEEDGQIPNHEYCLCGVATKPGVTYLLRGDRGTKTKEIGSETWQWWRTEYLNEPKMTKLVSSCQYIFSKSGGKSREQYLPSIFNRK